MPQNPIRATYETLCRGHRQIHRFPVVAAAGPICWKQPSLWWLQNTAGIIQSGGTTHGTTFSLLQFDSQETTLARIDRVND